MFESIEISVNILTPIFIMIISGVVLKKTGVLDDNSVRKLNAAAFKFFLPVTMLNSIYKSSPESMKWDTVLFAAAAIVAAFLFCFAVIPLVEKDKRRIGVLIQGIVRSNFAVFGYAVAASFCGGNANGLTAIVGAVALSLYGIFSTVALTVYGGGKVNFKKICVSIAKNPIVIGCAAGIVLMLTGIEFPKAINSALDSIGSAATPVSLVALGGFLSKGVFKGKTKEIIIGVGGKLLAMPAVFLTLAVLLGFRGTDLVILLSLFCTPTATASFAMTQQMSGDDELAAALVVTSCVGSFATVFVFITILHTMGMF